MVANRSQVENASRNSFHDNVLRVTFLKVMFEYLHQNRYDKGTGPNGILGGDVDGFGIRTQFFF